jgi:hypothetical protein
LSGSALTTHGSSGRDPDVEREKKGKRKREKREREHKNAMGGKINKQISERV